MSDESFELMPEDFLAGRAIPQEMITALRTIAELNTRTVERIVEYLSSLNGVTDENEVKEGIQDLLHDPDDDASENIVQTLLNVKPNAVSKTIKLLDRWRVSAIERRQFFPDDLFESLGKNLKALAAERKSIAIIRKANFLLRAVGNELDEVACVCDMRPVFDFARKEIDGFVVVANLRMLYRSQENTHHAFEVALTEDELRNLVRVGSEALGKMEVLKEASDKFRKVLRK